MSGWSDGRSRSERYRGSKLDVAVAEYFARRNEQERQRLEAENRDMRELKERAKTKAATA